LSTYKYFDNNFAVNINYSVAIEGFKTGYDSDLGYDLELAFVPDSMGTATGLTSYSPPLNSSHTVPMINYGVINDPVGLFDCSMTEGSAAVTEAALARIAKWTK
jgi:hypothetical protein